MNSDILYRTLLAFAIVAFGLAVFWAWNKWQLHRLSRAAQGRAPGLEGLRTGAAAVLYFTTADCSVCRTAQKPALEQLKAAFGELIQVIEINATERPAVADHWGVLSVPTTFIIDPQGQPRRVNHGLTSRAKLAVQLAEFLPPQPPASAAEQLAAK
jgi:thiol-disulfide isomerase/thioredoxin